MPFGYLDLITHGVHFIGVGQIWINLNDKQTAFGIRLTTFLCDHTVDVLDQCLVRLFTHPQVSNPSYTTGILPKHGCVVLIIIGLGVAKAEILAKEFYEGNSNGL
jgi:hypothetical protein